MKDEPVKSQRKPLTVPGKVTVLRITVATPAATGVSAIPMMALSMGRLTEVVTTRLLFLEFDDIPPFFVRCHAQVFFVFSLETKEMNFVGFFPFSRIS